MKKLIRLTAALAATLIGFNSAQAQTILNAGDITVLGVNTDSPDGFSFVTWVDLAEGTSFGFTDASYNGDGTWRGSESFATYQVPTGGLLAGSVIVSTTNGGSSQTYDVGSVVPTSTGAMQSGISDAGDQVFVFQLTTGTVAATTPFSGGGTAETFNATHKLLFGINIATGSFIGSGVASANISYLPDSSSGAGALTLGSTALNLGAASTNDNAQYTGARSGLTISEYKTAILNTANWSFDNTTSQSLDSTDFVIVPEPSAALAFLSGSALLALRRRRR